MDRGTVFRRRVSVGRLLDSRASIRASFGASNDRIRMLVDACVDAAIRCRDYERVADNLTSAVADHFAHLLMDDSQEFIYSFVRELQRALRKHTSEVLFELDYDWRSKHAATAGFSFVLHPSDEVKYRFTVRAD